jgi:pimeloyl-ACP methyl ester carboxylesterase
MVKASRKYDLTPSRQARQENQENPAGLPWRFDPLLEDFAFTVVIIGVEDLILMNCVLLLALMTALPIMAQDIAGDWIGTLHAGNTSLRILVHIARGADGALKADMDSLDQNAKAIPITSIELKGNKLTFTSLAVHGSYTGTVNSERTVIAGTFTQGAPLPLNFKRASALDADAPRRPQNPTKPYPYHEEDLTYESPAARIKIGATLTMPNGRGPFPAIVLITGSGQQDRDETLLGHKPFLVLADYLTRKGFAVLRSDDRGIGKSGGVFVTSINADFVNDTEAAVAYLKTRREIDPKRIGLIGHSGGGIVAPMVAARRRDIAFVVLMAGPGVPGDQVIVDQVIARAEAEGVAHAAAIEEGKTQRRVEDLIMKGHSDAALKEELRPILGAKTDSVVPQFTTQWHREFLSYDPAPALRKVSCPVLAMIGQKDVQVLPGRNLPAIRKALQEGGNKRFEVIEMPGLNHLFQTAKTGAVSEYGGIDETISLLALEKISGWITRATSSR